MRAARAILLFFVLVLFGCTRHTRTPPLTVGANVWLGYQPLVVGIELGLIPPDQARVVEFSSNTESLRAFRSGATQAAALTLDEMMLLAEDGLDPHIVLVIDKSTGADALVARPEIRNVADLKGRRVGVEDTALGAFVLTRALESAHLTVADVTMVRVPIDEHERAYLDGEVDAVVTFEPVRTYLRRAGAHVLFDSRSMPDEILDVLVVRGDVLANHPEQVDAILRGWFEALQRLDDPRLVERVSRNLRLTPEEVGPALNGMTFPSLEENRALLGGGHPRLVGTLERLQTRLLDRKLLGHSVDVARLPDPRPIERASP
jgi:NitT/TauT family transport system substrate-binding protein